MLNFHNKSWKMGGFYSLWWIVFWNLKKAGSKGFFIHKKEGIFIEFSLLFSPYNGIILA